MTDDYEPVTASDLKPGDEVEVVLRGVISERGFFRTEKSEYLYGPATVETAHTIRRKVRPIGVGDMVHDGDRDTGEVKGINGDLAWVQWKFAGHEIQRQNTLTRVTP
jgi:hypothetical protein